MSAKETKKVVPKQVTKKPKAAPKVAGTIYTVTCDSKGAIKSIFPQTKK